MTEERSKRRLAAILAADVVGFSRLMEVNEAGTLATLKSRRKEVLEPLVAQYQGRVFKVTGDGVLVEFASAVNAVQCAVELQQGMAAANTGQPEAGHIVLRIGVNLGDVMVEGGDLYGDGVNIAARLEALADSGGILVSGMAYDHVAGKLKTDFEDLGPRPLKNIVQPVRAYRVTGMPSVAAVAAPLPASEKPSIAVLAFTNMSGDPEQEYFSDGISEDIITDLSSIAAIRVLSRNTSFTFKGKSVNLAQTARQLNVRFILEGSVRKAGGRVRVTAQLIDGISDTHVWAERYDRALDDIFVIQDDISKSIVSSLKIRLLPEEQRAIEQRGTNNAEAYRLLLLARHYRYSNTIHDTRLALRFAQEALTVDPRYAEAWALVAASEIGLHEMAGAEETGLAAASRAIELDPGLALAFAAKGRVLCGLGHYEEAFAAHEESVRLSRDSYEVNFLYGRTCTELGQSERAIFYHERAAVLSQTEFLSLALAIQSYNALGNSEGARDASLRALARIEAAIARRPDDTSALYHGASILGELGQRERALEWANRALSIAPDEVRGLYLLACMHALLGETESSLDYLERSLERMQPRYLTWVQNDSDLDSIREHPRYATLIGKLNQRLAKSDSVNPM
jgi:adenylate cyclase